MFVMNTIKVCWTDCCLPQGRGGGGGGGWSMILFFCWGALIIFSWQAKKKEVLTDRTSWKGIKTNQKTTHNRVKTISVWDKFRLVGGGGGGGGWSLLPEYLFPLLARKSSGFFARILPDFCPKNGYLKYSRAAAPPPPPPGPQPHGLYAYDQNLCGGGGGGGNRSIHIHSLNYSPPSVIWPCWDRHLSG